MIKSRISLRTRVLTSEGGIGVGTSTCLVGSMDILLGSGIMTSNIFQDARLRSKHISGHG